MIRKSFLTLSFLLLIFAFKLNASGKSDAKLALVGTSSFSVLFWDIYDISLYSRDGKYIAGQLPVTLEITYKRKIDSVELVEETENQWQRYKIDNQKKRRWLKALSLIWPDVDEKDIITFHINENKQTSFYFNQGFIGKIDDEEFAIAFSNIWLDVKGPYPKMTKRLIGKNK